MIFLNRNAILKKKNSYTSHLKINPNNDFIPPGTFIVNRLKIISVPPFVLSQDMVIPSFSFSPLLEFYTIDDL